MDTYSISPYISVIIPVYNTEKYLESCINSILSQTFTDFEVILVDDGSSDNSSKICDEYVEKDNRIKVIHQKNGGTSSARYAGVLASCGEYVTFVDSDDELYTDALSILVTNTDNTIDILVSDAIINEIITSEAYIKYILTWKLTGSMCWRLFRRELFSTYVQDVPRNITIGEDQLMNIKLTLGRNLKIKCIREKVYNYRANSASITNTQKFSLEYEEYFMSERVKVLGKYKRLFDSELCYYNLKTLENLIVCRVHVPYNRPWVKEILLWSKGQKFNYRNWVVVNIRHNLLCKYLLAIEKRIRSIIAD